MFQTGTVEETDVPRSPSVARAPHPSLSSIMDQLMRMITFLDEHSDGSHTSFNEMNDRLDEHIGESRASFKEIYDQLNDPWLPLPSCPNLIFPLFGVT